MVGPGKANGTAPWWEKLTAKDAIPARPVSQLPSQVSATSPRAVAPSVNGTPHGVNGHAGAAPAQSTLALPPVPAFPAEENSGETKPEARSPKEGAARQRRSKSPAQRKPQGGRSRASQELDDVNDDNSAEFERDQPTAEELLESERDLEEFHKAQEAAAARKREEGVGDYDSRKAALMSAQLTEVPLLTREEEIAIAGRIANRAIDPNDANDAFDHLVRANLKLSRFMALKYRDISPFLTVDDLYQEGVIGLMKAAEKFDPLGYHTSSEDIAKPRAKFSSYAMWWIKQSMKRALANQGEEVRRPVHVGALHRRMLRVAGEFHARERRRPTDKELWNAFNAKYAKADEPKSFMKFDRFLEIWRAPVTTSGHTPLGEEGDEDLFSILPDGDAVDPAREEARANYISVGGKALETALSGLDYRKRMILRHRFGFEGDPKTLEEVGVIIGVTRERIRQLQAEALRTLRLRAPKALAHLAGQSSEE